MCVRFFRLSVHSLSLSLSLSLSHSLSLSVFRTGFIPPQEGCVCVYTLIPKGFWSELNVNSSAAGETNTQDHKYWGPCLC